MQKKHHGIARIIGSLVVAAIVPAIATGPAQAQQARELYAVNHYDVPIAHAPAFVTHVETIAAAAQRVGAKGVSWHGYRDGGRISLVFPLVSMATMDDTDRFPRAFRGTAAESAWTEFFNGFYGLPWSMTSEVIERVPALSYAPARAGEETVVRVSTTVVAPGRTQEYEAFIRDVNAVRTQVGYPYRVEIFRPIVGEARRYIAVTFYDSREAYHGANAMTRLLAANPQAQATWNGFGERNRALALRNTYSDMNIVRSMTYAPPAQ
jgi:hypothetical protein